MNPEYTTTLFLASPPTGGFPIRFGVVTACNPQGRIVDEAMNMAATQQLCRQLQDAERVFFPVTGCSPDLTHQEPGFGIVFRSTKETVTLGQVWHQEAVFWVEDGTVHLVGCGGEASIMLGSWESRVQSPPLGYQHPNPIIRGE